MPEFIKFPKIGLCAKDVSAELSSLARVFWFRLIVFKGDLDEARFN